MSAMMALTLWRPWPWAMTRAVPLKTIENRTWPPPARLIGQRLALHAGKHYDGEGEDYIRTIDPRIPARDGHPHSVIVGVVTVAGAMHESGARWVGEVDYDDVLVESPWFFGPWGWLCTDLRVLSTPVPCKGHQGIWHLPAEVDDAVRAQVDPMSPARPRPMPQRNLFIRQQLDAERR